MIRVAAEQFAEKSEELLARVEKGEEVWIEKGGRVVARLVAPMLSAPADAKGGIAPPDDPLAESDLARAIADLRAGNRLGKLEIRDLIEEGRP